MLKILRWENYPGLHKWTHCNHNGLYMRVTGGVQVRQRWCNYWRRGTENELCRCYSFSFLFRGRGPWANNCRWPVEGGKGEEIKSPREPQITVLLTDYRLPRTNMCWFKPLNLLQFIAVAIRNKYILLWQIIFAKSCLNNWLLSLLAVISILSHWNIFEYPIVSICHMIFFAFLTLSIEQNIT